MNKSIEIKKWLLEEGLRQADLAREIGASRSLVCRVISGERCNGPVARRVLEQLKTRGCPVLDESEDDVA